MFFVLQCIIDICSKLAFSSNNNNNNNGELLYSAHTMLCAPHTYYPWTLDLFILLAQFSLYEHKGGLKPDSFHFIGPVQILIISHLHIPVKHHLDKTSCPIFCRWLRLSTQRYSNLLCYYYVMKASCKGIWGPLPRATPPPPTPPPHPLPI